MELTSQTASYLLQKNIVNNFNLTSLGFPRTRFHEKWDMVEPCKTWFITSVLFNYVCVVQLLLPIHYILLNHIISCWITLYSVESHYLLLNHIIYCWITLYPVESHYILLNHIIYCWITLYTVESHYILLNHIISCWFTLYPVDSHYIVLNHII